MRLSLFIISLIITSKIFAQGEAEFPLYYNSQLKNFKLTTPALKVLADTLNLPFIDDFSDTYLYPSAEKWTDSSVFINSGYPVDPVTLGVATFDGVDKNGNAYDWSTPNTYGVADLLTSKYINLNYLPTENVQLSFFVQPQGRGNVPENTDSLVLEFLNSNNDWVHIWSSAGTPYMPFAQQVIDITDTQFLYSGFKFRFKNYSTLSGNVDHWLLDYVRLDKGVNHSVIEDVAFAEYAPSLLNVYQEMPWSHYITNASAFTKSDISLRIKNNNNFQSTVSIRDNIYDDAGNVLLTINPTTHQMPVNNYYQYQTPLNSFTFTSPNPDSASFLIEHILNTTPDLIRSNDTIRRWQNFYNYYAYDDGTAESAYGFVNSPNAKLAYEFSIAKTDTLRAVQMFWNQLNYPANLMLFRLAIWTNYNQSPVYQQINQHPVYTDSINGFHTYIFDTPLPVAAGTIYVGFIQDGPDNMNLGLDKNQINNSKMWFNTSGIWNQSLVQGSVMIRPAFGEEIFFTSVPEVIVSNQSIYPNPANEFIYFKDNFEKTITIHNAEGKFIKKEKAFAKIDVSSLSSGVYFLRVDELNSTKSYISKFIIQK